jgi:hypothetical protein
MRGTLPLLVLLCLLVSAAATAAAGEPTPKDEPATGEVEGLPLVLRPGVFEMVEGPEGLRLEMEGFAQRGEPGAPLLPGKEILVLLPPGARPTGVLLEGLQSEVLPGTHAVAPAPPVLPLADPEGARELLKEELARRAATRSETYARDAAYPAEPVRLAGSGTLRKYSYARVEFSPFAYHPASGRLVHHREAQVRVLYDLPERGSERARHLESLIGDTAADRRAAGLFVNFADLRRAYQPRPETGPDSRDLAEHHDYVILTTEALLPALEASGFQAWKSSLGFNLRVVLMTDPEITGQPGADLAERVRNFLRANYGPWGVEHVLIVGSYLDVPMRLCYPDPENHLHDPADPGTGPGSVPTDAYYADLSFTDAESWDLDGDGFHGEWGEDLPDFAPEVYVGRIPTNIPARVTYTLDKIVRVEQDTGAWKRHALHAGAILFFENQNYSGIPLRDGAVYADEVASRLMQGWTLSRYSEQSGLVTSVFPWPALTLYSFLNDWISGTYGFVNWAGHGWPDGVYRTIWNWDDGDGVPETDGSDGISSDAFIADHLPLDDDYPSIVCAVSCDVGYPEPNDSNGNLGVHLLTDPSMGTASAVVSSTRYAAVSRDWPAEPNGAESHCYEFNRYLIAGPGGSGGPRYLGPALYDGKLFNHVRYGWDRDYEYRNLYNYNLYGDPAMEWRGAGERRGNLLRNTDITGLHPVEPPVGECLPLDPVEDLYLPDFVAGNVDPDSGHASPLVFYQVDGPVFLWLEETPSGEIRIDF